MTPSRLAFALLLTAAAPALAQTSAPATDSAAQASPVRSMPQTQAVDSAAQASPGLGANPQPSRLVPGGITLTVRIDAALDSGTLHNGQIVHATLVSSPGLAGVAANAPVDLAVIGATPAGRINPAGELSLAVSTVANRPAFTDTQTFHGQAGAKDLPDSAPAPGTNATVPAGTTLVFHTQKTPVAAGS